MNMHIEQAIDEILYEERKYDEMIHYYSGEYLNRISRKIENTLYDLRIKSNSIGVDNIINDIKRSLKKVNSLIKETLQKNKIILSYMAEGDSINNGSIIHELDAVHLQIRDLVMEQLNPSQLKYNMINELRLYEHEQAKYEIGRILTNDLNELYEEIVNETNRTIHRVIETNTVVYDISKREEIIIVELDENKKFTIEKQGNSNNIRKYNPKDEFECTKKYTDMEAQKIYMQALAKATPEEKKKIENIVEGPKKIEKEIVIVQLDENRKFTIEKIENKSKVRPYNLNDEFECNSKYADVAAQNIYNNIMQTAPIKVQEYLQTILSEQKEQSKIFIITTSDNKMYTIEEYDENLTLRPYQQSDEFICSKRFFGKEADELYKQLSSSLNANQEISQQLENNQNNMVK